MSRRLLRYTPDTHICSADFQLRFEQKDVSYVRAEMDESGIVCYYQSVKERLIPRLLNMAAERSLNLNNVKVSSAKGRWGSCSSKGNINLSLYLVLLPRHLQDYVLQHELTHLVEMNHSPRFWARLDEVCEGKAKALRKEMRGYNTSFL